MLISLAPTALSAPDIGSLLALSQASILGLGRLVPFLLHDCLENPRQSIIGNPIIGNQAPIITPRHQN